jgi:hypothetical protein
MQKLSSFNSSIFGSKKINLNELRAGVIASFKEKLDPLIANLESVLQKTDIVTSKTDYIITYLPFIFAMIDLVVIIMYLGLIISLIINPKNGFGIPISREIYSSYYIITSIILCILIFYFANPVLNNIEKLKTEPKTSKVEEIIDKLLSFFNRIISISVVPVIIIETIYIVLLVFIISFMFVISTAMVRTYFALQCSYDQTIRASWWAYLVDVIMYCLLFISLVFWIIFELFGNLFDTKSAIFYSRRLFVITVAYYILQVIFSSIEYAISNNIVAISKWEEPLNECESPADKAKNKTPQNIFYYFLNIVLCFCIWVLIIILIIGHFYVAMFFSIYISKAKTIIQLVTQAFLFIFSGMITLKSIEEQIKTITKTASSVIPGGIPKGTPDVVKMAKDEVAKVLAANPDIDVEDFIKKVIEKGTKSLSNGSGETLFPKNITDGDIRTNIGSLFPKNAQTIELPPNAPTTELLPNASTIELPPSGAKIAKAGAFASKIGSLFGAKTPNIKLPPNANAPTIQSSNNESTLETGNKM